MRRVSQLDFLRITQTTKLCKFEQLIRARAHTRAYKRIEAMQIAFLTILPNLILENAPRDVIWQ